MNLRFHQNQSLLSNFGLERLQAFLRVFQIVASPNATHTSRELLIPFFASSLATRTWPHVSCSTASAATAK